MAKIDFNFLALCHAISDRGLEYGDRRRDVKRLQIPSYTFRHDFKDGFPILSIKEVPFKMIVGELIWFLRGDNDIDYLNENGIKIWNADAYNWYVKEFRANEMPGDEFPMMTLKEFSAIGKGSVGQNYSMQWRFFNGNTDQIMDLIRDMKDNIMSSRLKVNAWNPSEVNETALPPCHSEFQIIGVPLRLSQRIDIAIEKGLTTENAHLSESDWLPWLEKREIPEFGFELHWNQRSVDTFLGLPFNITSYGLLAKILEKITGFPALGIEGTLKCVHFYDNQYEAVAKLVERDPYRNKAPELKIDFNFDEIFPEMFDEIQIENITLEGYEFQDSIIVKMLAPKEL